MTMSGPLFRSSAASGVLALACALLAGCAGKNDTAGAGGGGFAMPPTPVETAPARNEPVVDRFAAVGTIEAGELITVVSEIDAIVTRLPFAEGSRVNRGALLVQLDDEELKAQLARAEAVLEQSRINHTRVKALIEKGAVAQQELDNVSSALKVAEADLDLARVRLARTRVTAPFAGIVGAKKVSVGAYVRAGEVLTDLAQVEKLKVTFAAPERYLKALNKGAEVTMSAPAFPGRTLAGTIDVIEPVLDAETRSARIMARADNPDGLFRPGMSADVEVILARRDNAVTVPAEAVFVQGNQSFVYVVGADSSVAMSPVSLGTRTAATVEVVDGLTAGATVVRAGHQKLYPGAKVMPVGGEGPGGPGGGGPAAAAQDGAGAPGASGETGAAPGASGESMNGAGATGSAVAASADSAPAPAETVAGGKGGHR